MLTKLMKQMRVVGIVLAGFVLFGCSASQMTNVEKTGFLEDYSKLVPGDKDQAALVYINQQVDFKQYDKILFERVTVWLTDDAEYQGIDPTELKELTDYFQQALLDAVKDGYQVVDDPGPGVLWVRAAVTDVKPSKPTANTLSTILPVGWVVAGASKAAADKNLGTGQAAAEFEVIDAMTGEQLAAAIDRRQGGKAAFEGKWEDTQAAFDFWAKRFRTRLDELRGVAE